MFGTCSECGTMLECLDDTGEANYLCKECNEQFIYCFTQCETPCRSKEEQKRYYDKWKPNWDIELQ